MKYWARVSSVVAMSAVSCTLLCMSGSVTANRDAEHFLVTPNGTGFASVYSRVPLDFSNPFFQSLGSNGRSCGSCHQADTAFSITPQNIQARFARTRGTDPVFRTNDGSVCPTADVSSVQARRAAYSMLLRKAVIRVSMPIPANADFELASVDDPYSCTSANDIAMFRRPLPAANLQFLSAVMWDGRESGVSARDITGDLGSQAIDATTGHAQATQPPTPEQVQQIVAFEQALSVAQLWDSRAGDLDSSGGRGGAFLLAQQPFYIGINDVLGADPTGKSFDAKAMTVYAAWESNSGRDDDEHDGSRRAARASVARGEALFNTLPIPISGVKGLNDKLNLPVINGTCTTCHDSPNAGDHSVKLPIDIGVADAARRTPDMPLYTFRSKLSGATVQTTDPGRAMISGKFDDIGKFKGPVLRALAARPPYFHNGMAKDLTAAVEFYDTRFQLHLSAQQKSDLVAFLRSL